MRIGLRADEIRPVRRRKTRKASPRTKAPTRQPGGIACFDFRLAGADVVILDRETLLLEPQDSLPHIPFRIVLHVPTLVTFRTIKVNESNVHLNAELVFFIGVEMH